MLPPPLLSARLAGRCLGSAPRLGLTASAVRPGNVAGRGQVLKASPRGRVLFATTPRRWDDKDGQTQKQKQHGGSKNSKPSTSSPLEAIRAKVSSAAAQANLHEDIYTIPNFLTFTRLVAAPFVGYFVLHDNHAWAVGLFAYAGVTDLLDGWIARKWNRQTVVGTVIDPMADKALMTVLTICLAVKGALPIWVAALILGRDVGLGIAAIYYRWISLPPPKTFTRYWDFSLPSAEVRPTTISKYNTFLQLALVGTTTAAPLVGADMTSMLSALQYIVATTTVWSGLSYVFSKDAVRILNDAKVPPKGPS